VFSGRIKIKRFDPLPGIQIFFHKKQCGIFTIRPAFLFFACPPLSAGQYCGCKVGGVSNLQFDMLKLFRKKPAKL
jgi:hypothetical protein